MTSREAYEAWYAAQGSLMMTQFRVYQRYHQVDGRNVRQLWLYLVCEDMAKWKQLRRLDSAYHIAQTQRRRVPLLHLLPG